MAYTEDSLMNSISERNGQECHVAIPARSVQLEGHLVVPEGAQGIVLFAHGSGSSRHSPRNRYVAKVLQDANLATLLIDLLAQREAAFDMQLRFDIPLLSDRLVSITDWLTRTVETKHLNVGYFGASTGAGAALMASTKRPDVVQAIVSRGGRPDLAGKALPLVRASTLLIVGGHDYPVIAMNREALAQITSEKRLEIVPGATHLFEEPGALEAVAKLASEWFEKYLTPAS
jgi:putative phosphoribosyl transferase